MKENYSLKHMKIQKTPINILNHITILNKKQISLKNTVYD